MKIVDVEPDKKATERKAAFYADLAALQMRAAEFFPGCRLELVAGSEEKAQRTGDTSPEGDPFLSLEGIEKIREVLRGKALRPAQILAAIAERGAVMEGSLVRTYLARGLKRNIFQANEQRQYSLCQPAEPPNHQPNGASPS